MFKDSDLHKLEALGFVQYKPKPKTEGSINVMLWVETLGMVQDPKTQQVYVGVTRKPYKGRIPPRQNVKFVPAMAIRTVRVVPERTFKVHPRELVRMSHNHAAMVL